MSAACTRCFGDPECRCADLFAEADAREDAGAAIDPTARHGAAGPIT